MPFKGKKLPDDGHREAITDGSKPAFRTAMRPRIQKEHARLKPRSIGHFAFLSVRRFPR